MNSTAFQFILPLLILLSFSACSQSEDQREFEQEAFSEPNGFTETADNGSIVDGREDPDDWRAAPFYQGQIQVDPAYPNPVRTNELLKLRIFVNYLDVLNGVRVYELHNFLSGRGSIYTEFQQPLPTGWLEIPLNPLDIAEVRENPQGLYRIIALDPQGNVITYGDIQIE